jgi:hypothetical protein
VGRDTPEGYPEGYPGPRFFSQPQIETIVTFCGMV